MNNTVHVEVVNGALELCLCMNAREGKAGVLAFLGNTPPRAPKPFIKVRNIIVQYKKIKIHAKLHNGQYIKILKPRQDWCY